MPETPFSPPAVRLEGERVVLTPMTPDDHAELRAAIALPEVFAGGYGGGPSGLADTAEGFAAFVRAYYPWATGTPYLVRDADGRAVGTSSLADVHPTHRRAHLGWTAYHPSVWGTAVNPEAKLLLLGHAFAHGAERVKLQADGMNARSCAAIERLGATYEGTLRHHQRRPDGSWRDTVVFSVLREEWPSVRDGLRERLDAFGG